MFLITCIVIDRHRHVNPELTDKWRSEIVSHIHIGRQLRILYRIFIDQGKNPLNGIFAETTSSATHNFTLFLLKTWSELLGTALIAKTLKWNAAQYFGRDCLVFNYRETQKLTNSGGGGRFLRAIPELAPLSGACQNLSAQVIPERDE